MDSFIRRIVWHYLFRCRRSGAAFINGLNVLGICLGIFALLTVSSVMNGFDRDVRKKILAFKSDLKVSRTNGTFVNYQEILEQIKGIDFVVSATPVIENELMVQSGDGLQGTLCKGIDIGSYSIATDLPDKIIIGGVSTSEDLERGIILGMDMAVALNVTVGEFVQLSSVLGTEVTPFGFLPKSRRYVVKGIFISGIPEYDQNISYITLPEGQYFFNGKDQIDHIEVYSRDPDRSAVYCRELKKILGTSVKVEDWKEYEANLFNAIRMEKILMIMVLMLIIILAGFNIAGNLNRLVTEKRLDIGIMKSWGVSSMSIHRVFIGSGLLIGLNGIICGLIIAFCFLQAQIKWEFIKIPVTEFPLDSIPVEMRLADFIIIPLIALSVVILASLAPASKAMNLTPLKIIRNK